MATVNNWLAFSLSPQELPPSQANSALISAATTGDASAAADVCFNIPQDWSTRGSELSALVAEPKLEDFLGGISFSEQHHGKGGVIPSSAAACYANSGSSVGYLYPSSSSLQFADSVMVASSAVVHDGVSGGIDGQGGMRLICGTTAAEEKGKLARVGKVNNYEKELEEMKHMTRQEFVASLRRKSSGFSRGASIYRGVTRHHQHGRWQARIGRVAGNKDLYLGTFSTQEEAAEAYDIAAIKFRGLNAVTNFDMSRYDVKSILDSGALPAMQHAGGGHGLGSIDNASLEHSTGSNSVVYNGDAGGYMMPMSAASAAATVGVSHDQHAAQGGHGDGGKHVQMGYDNYLVGADAYGGAGRMPSWTTTPASAPAATSSSDMTGVCHGGAQLFSVWNDT
uniref:AP2/ERF domain-containing protein n=1 Tax=Oryza brachyantha TaxID=4533 RepID=J3L6S9_ORYBR